MKALAVVMGLLTLQFVTTALAQDAAFLSGSEVPKGIAQNTSTQPYSIQKDMLGESLRAYRLNDPSCKLHSLVENLHIDGAQSCVDNNLNLTYAGVPLIGKLGEFYQGHLYRVVLLASHYDCERFGLFDSLKNKFGEPESKHRYRDPEGKK